MLSSTATVAPSPIFGTVLSWGQVARESPTADVIAPAPPSPTMAYAEVLAPQIADFRACLTDCSGTYYSSDALTASAPKLACQPCTYGRYTAADKAFGVAVTDGVVILLQVGYPFT